MTKSVLSNFGLGLYKLSLIQALTGVSAFNVREEELTLKQMKKLNFTLELSFFKGIKETYVENKQYQIENLSYRGLRCLHGLPVRGQRTKRNSLVARKFSVGLKSSEPIRFFSYDYFISEKSVSQLLREEAVYKERKHFTHGKQRFFNLQSYLKKKKRRGTFKKKMVTKKKAKVEKKGPKRKKF